MKKALLIIATENFRDEELFNVKAEVEKQAQVSIASKTGGESKGMLGATANAELSFEDIKVDDYDAIVFIGGSGSSMYFDDPKALDIAKQADEKSKIVGAICIAPSILANAGLLQGKKATAFSSQADNLKEKGAEFTGNEVEVSGKIVTGSGPSASTSFGKEIAKLLEQ